MVAKRTKFSFSSLSKKKGVAEISTDTGKNSYLQKKATKKLKFEFIYELKFHIIIKGCCKNLNKFIYKLI